MQEVDGEFFIKLPESYQEYLADSFHKYTHSDFPDGQIINFTISLTKQDQETKKYRISTSIGDLRYFYSKRLLSRIGQEA